MSVNIGVDTDTAPIYTFDSSPQVVLDDEPTAAFSVHLNPTTDIPLLEEGETYRYDVFTTSAAGDKLHQKGGALRLRPVA